MIGSLLKPGRLAVLVLTAAALLGVSLTGAFGVNHASAQDRDDEAASAPSQAPEIVRVIPLNRSGHYTITVVWRGIEDASVTGYELQRRRAGSGNWVTAFSGHARQIAFNNSGLTTGLKYEFRVRARNGEGPGPWSEVRPKFSPEELKRAPVLRRAGPVNDMWHKTWVSPHGTSQVQIFWRHQGVVEGRCTVYNDAKYRFRFFEQGKLAESKLQETSSTSHVFVGVTPGKRYVMMVRAYSDECRNWSKIKRISWLQDQ